MVHKKNVRNLIFMVIPTLSLGFQSHKLRSRTKVLFAEPGPASIKKITIPQRYLEERTPEHQNAYPSVLHSIYVTPLLSKDQAEKCLQIAKDYAVETECWKSKDAERHVSYSTADFPIEDCSKLESYFDEIEFEKNTFKVIGKLFDVDEKDLSFMDLFCAHYKGKNDSDSVMDRLALHRDGTVISFTIVLSSPDDYEGGGTEFDALLDATGRAYEEFGDVLSNGVVKVRSPGHGVVHSGKIQHGAHVVKSGERTTLTGFVEVDDRCIRRGTMGEACKQWGRMDNAKKRRDRQKDIVGELDENQCATSGWMLSSGKFLQRKDATKNRSHVVGFAPAFSSVQRRGSIEHMREKNLQTEDILLRDILLPMEERIHPMDQFGLSQFGDITIL